MQVILQCQKFPTWFNDFSGFKSNFHHKLLYNSFHGQPS